MEGNMNAILSIYGFSGEMLIFECPECGNQIGSTGDKPTEITHPTHITSDLWFSKSKPITCSFAGKTFKRPSIKLEEVAKE